MTYGQYVGLLMNVRRVRDGRILDQLRAICYAQNNSDLPVSLFESMAANYQQAEDLAFDVNAQRRVNRMMSEE